MDKDFMVPVTFMVPVEDEEEAERKSSEEATYISLKEAKIMKRYNKPNSSLGRVGKYIQDNWQKEEMSYDEINKELEIKTAQSDVRDLNSLHRFTFKAVPSTYVDNTTGRRKFKKGFFVSCLKDVDITEDYIRRNSRIIATKKHVLSNVEYRARIKQQEVLKEKVKEKKEKQSVTQKVKGIFSKN
jgi:hypothetical protein